MLLGVRGSTPAPGAGFVRYRGHTSCVAVLPDGAGAPRSSWMQGRGCATCRACSAIGPSGHDRVTHLHWDQVQGVPFTPAVDHPEAEVLLLLPAQQGRDAKELLARSMSPPSFPITPDGLQGRWRFSAIEPGPTPLARCA